MNLTLNLKSLELVNEYRNAVEAEYREGRLTKEERAIAWGNLDEAAAKIRLREIHGIELD